MGNYLGGVIVRNVTDPTLVPFLPDPAKANGTAVIVAPGGAFWYLGISGEGDLARRLAEHGVTAFVLKYCTISTPREPQQFLMSLFGMLAARTKDIKEGTNNAPLVTPAEAIEDGEAAVSLVRSRAATWKIDPAHRRGRLFRRRYAGPSGRAKRGRRRAAGLHRVVLWSVRSR